MLLFSGRSTMWKMSWQLVFSVIAVTGCTSMCSSNRSGMTPEQVVEAYLDVALNMKDVSERDLLVEYTTGTLKSAIESASPETIKSAYVNRHYQIQNYSVVERRDRTPRETEITFQLTYADLGSGEKDVKEAPKVTTENTVAVVKASGIWLIRDVLGNKTSIDFPVSEAARITARPGPGIDTPDDMAPAPVDEPAIASPEAAVGGGLDESSGTP